MTTTTKPKRKPNAEPAVNGHGPTPGAQPSTLNVTITLPVCPPDPDSYIAQSLGRINTRLDTPQQLAGMRQLHAGLREANATLNSGRPVDGVADVLRWLFEEISDQLSAVSEQLPAAA